jgi:hypothetical protein
MRATGPEDVDAIALATEGDFAQKPDDNVVDLLQDSIDWAENSSETPTLTHDLETNGMEMYICASSAASKTMTWKLYAWRNENGPAKLAAEGTAITGTQQVVKFPHNGVDIANTFWCDQIDVTYHNWPKGIVGTDPNGDSNSVGSLWMDSCGYRFFRLEFVTTGTADPATNITAFYGRF